MFLTPRSPSSRTASRSRSLPPAHPGDPAAVLRGRSLVRLGLERARTRHPVGRSRFSTVEAGVGAVSDERGTPKSTSLQAPPYGRTNLDRFSRLLVSCGTAASNEGAR
jgi:hypothetical protein